MKKLLAFILSITMLAGFIPASFAAGTETEEKNGFEFVFTHDAHTTTADTASGTVCPFELSGREILHTVDTTDESVSDRWGYVAQSFPNGSVSVSTEQESIRVSFYRPGRDPKKFVSFNPDNESQTVTALCLELEVTKAGRYKPVFTYKNYRVGPTAELYLVPKDGSITNGATLSSFVKNLDAKYRIGVVDTYGTTTELAAPYVMRAIDVSKGNYYFIMVPNGENPIITETNTAKETYQYFLPVSLALTPITEPASYTYDFTTNAVASTYDIDALNQSVKAKTLDYGPMYTALSAFGNTPTIDATKTGKWSVANTRYVCNALKESKTYTTMTEDGFSFLLYRARYHDTTSGNSYYKDGVWNNGIGSCTGVTFVIDVPKDGIYDLSIFNNVAHEYGGYTQVYFGKATSTAMGDGAVTTHCTSASTKSLGWHNSSAVHNGTSAAPAESFEVAIPTAGTYFIYFSTDEGSFKKNEINLTDSSAVKENGVYGYQTLNITKITLDEVSEEEGESFVNVDAGNAPVSVNGAETDSVINTVSADVLGNSISVEGIIENSSSISAPETFGDYEFLYWTKDIGLNKKIVSHENTYNFIPTPGRTIFTAVYREKGIAETNKVMFYNANGDIAGAAEVNDGKVTTPALPRLAGFGKAKGWKLAGSKEIFPGSTEIDAEGGLLFVADYNDLEADIIVTVNGGEGSGSYSWGDSVTVSAPSRKDGSSTELFNYWTKNVDGKEEIVSFEKTYNFCAWEDCTLTAVYSDFIPVADTVRKILLGSVSEGDETTVVAEFIGFDNAVERGIAFGNNPSFASLRRTVMNSRDLNHLAVINDENEDCIAYAITADGKVYYSK